MSIATRLLAAYLITLVATVGLAGEKKSDGKKSAGKSARTLAENAFKTADADKSGSLDADELREARRVLRGALQAGLRGKVDADSKLHDQIADLAGGGKPDANKDGKITSDEFTAFVKNIMDQRDEKLKDAQKQEAADRAKAKENAEDAREKARIQELQRKLEQERRNDRRRRKR